MKAPVTSGTHTTPPPSKPALQPRLPSGTVKFSAENDVKTRAEQSVLGGKQAHSDGTDLKLAPRSNQSIWGEKKYLVYRTQRHE